MIAQSRLPQLTLIVALPLDAVLLDDPRTAH